MIKEDQIEQILYECPWLLNFNYEVSNIIGTKGKGRQIPVFSTDMVKSQAKKIDLLFIDSTDSRPIIIELKSRKLKRRDIGQILQYRAMIVDLHKELKEQWDNEYGKKYLAPKLLLIGHSADNDLLISASLAGIEVRTYETLTDNIEIPSYENYITSLIEWRKQVELGDPPINSREVWVEQVLHRLQKFLDQKTDSEYTTISNLSQTTKDNSYLAEAKYPFIDFPINQEKDNIFGFYEFHDDLPFLTTHFYCEPKFIHDLIEKVKVQDSKEINQIFQQEFMNCQLVNIGELIPYAEKSKMYPILKIEKPILSDDEKCQLFLNSLLSFEENVRNNDQILHYFEIYKISKMKPIWAKITEIFKNLSSMNQTHLSISENPTLGTRKYITSDKFPTFRFKIKIAEDFRFVKIGFHIYSSASPVDTKKFEELKINEKFQENLHKSISKVNDERIFQTNGRDIYFAKKILDNQLKFDQDLYNLTQWILLIIEYFEKTLESQSFYN